VTPHEGELSRLIGAPAERIRRDRERFARDAARRFKVIVVLKGRGTVVTDGEALYVNPTGNPGMATAGAGDVLTGVIAALLAQKLPPWDAARLGVWLHGRAGDLAAADRAGAPLLAGDLVEALPRALRERIG
jgi:NAD(P)H-hydrate epimerase